jgi:tight adherence protein B
MNIIFDTATALYVLLFLGILCFVEGTFYLVAGLRDGPEKRVNRRLKLVSGNSNLRAVLRKMRREDHGWLSDIINRAVPWMDRLIAQSGSEVSTLRVAVLMLALTLLLFSFVKLVSFASTVEVLIPAALIGVGGPLVFFYVKRRRRMNKFVEQLPQAIDILRSSLKAGHPVATACSLVANEMPDPMGSEFGLLTDETTYGMDFDEALYNLARRIPKQDVEFFVVSLTVARSTGGNLAEILGNLAQVLRDRSRMHAKIRAVSAEGRWSGMIMGLVPVWVSGMLMLFAPDYLVSVANDPIFWPAMMVAGILLAIGQIIIYKLVRFRV